MYCSEQTSSSLTSRPCEYNLTILHVNDVYAIEPVQGLGGIAELKTLINKEKEETKLRNAEILVVVCGDFLSASAIAGRYKGKHMIDLFNLLEIDYVVFGNHEFDFGNRILTQRIQGLFSIHLVCLRLPLTSSGIESKFQWLGANVLNLQNEAFGGSKPYGRSLLSFLFFCDSESRFLAIKQFPGFSVGLFGLCTRETPNLSFPDKDVQFAPIIPSAKIAVDALQNLEVDAIVGLTHLCFAEDKEVARNLSMIDLLLGGHDHVPHSLFQGSTFITKVGQSGEWLGRVDLCIQEGRGRLRKQGIINKTSKSLIRTWKVIANTDVEPDRKMKAKIQEMTEKFQESLKQVIAELGSPLGTLLLIIILNNNNNTVITIKKNTTHSL